MSEPTPKRPEQSVDIKANNAFCWLWTDQAHRYKVLMGGAGSGKSHSVGQYLLSQFLTVPGCNQIWSRKVHATLRGSVFALAKKLLTDMGCRDAVDINEDMRIRHRYNKNQIFFIGVDDPEKMKSITAENGDIEKVWMEEASEYDKEDMRQFGLRLRGSSAIKKELIITFNPISEEHWLKSTFFDKDDPRVITHHSTYRDNAFIDDDYRAELESLKHDDPYHYTVYALGEWGAVGDNATIIAYRDVYAARYREAEQDPHGPLEIGVDCARFGDDSTVAYARRAMTTLGVIEGKKMDGVAAAMMVLAFIAKHRRGGEPVKIKVDVGGLGASVVDALRLLCRQKREEAIIVIEVNFGGTAKEVDRYANIAAEMYFNFAKIIQFVTMLKEDATVIPELTKRRYEIDNRTGRLKLEPKDAYKKRIGHSPDHADALVLAYYEPANSQTWLSRLI